MNIEQLYLNATGFEPYDFQRRVAEAGLPELLQIPTGCGKTEAVGLGWLYRRRFHADAAVRFETPRWLIIALPMRTLVEQTVDRFEEWLERLGLNDEVGLHTVQGGIGWSDRDWRLTPDRDAVFVGTIDMLLSRALNRGYGDGRWYWPMSFGGFNNGAHWVFDEIQLMDVATPNTRQLQSFRESLGTALPTSSTWMSATVDDRLMCTVDRPIIGLTITLNNRDRNEQLAQRLNGTRTVKELELPAKKSEQVIAEELIAHHQPDTLTLAVFNTVDRAVSVWRQLRKLKTPADVVLLHSRYRPEDRRRHTETALSPPGNKGKIVVSTQVLEAGIDLSASVLFTEAAPWPCIVQRAGRCNREGVLSDAKLVWASPLKPSPYEKADIDASKEDLQLLERQELTVEGLLNRDVRTSSRITPVLRRKDLIELFDTSPDLSGNDLDVARFIRDSDNRVIQVAWREVKDGQPVGDSPHSAELCGVPIAEFRRRLKNHRAWYLDHLCRDRDRPWVRCKPEDLRDGLVVVLDASNGGYDPEIGWNRNSRQPVEVVTVEMSQSLAVEHKLDEDVAVGDDPASLSNSWYPLAAHLIDVEHECQKLLQSFKADGISAEMRQAVILAGRYHDIGKASHVWQEAALDTADEQDRMRLAESGPYAKTDNCKRLRLKRCFFRHELASALALMNEGQVVLKNLRERDLAVYLIASHHGRVRLSIRRLPEEYNTDNSETTVLGIVPEDELPKVIVNGSTVPHSHLTIPEGKDRYERRMLALRDRADLGPFRLAFLELIVRSADWQASRYPGRMT